MKQITPKIKAKIFALYLGAELHVSETPKEPWYPFDKHEGALELIGVLSNVAIVLRIAEQVSDRFDQTALHLQPLSSISDEDAIEVCRLGHDDRGDEKYKAESGKALLSNYIKSSHCNVRGEWWIEIADYLRSKGYALPAFGYSVNELVESGVFKLKEVNND